MDNLCDDTNWSSKLHFDHTIYKCQVKPTARRKSFYPSKSVNLSLRSNPHACLFVEIRVCFGQSLWLSLSHQHCLILTCGKIPTWNWQTGFHFPSYSVTSICKSVTGEHGSQGSFSGTWNWKWALTYDTKKRGRPLRLLAWDDGMGPESEWSLRAWQRSSSNCHTRPQLLG